MLAHLNVSYLYRASSDYRKEPSLLNQPLKVLGFRRSANSYRNHHLCLLHDCPSERDPTFASKSRDFELGMDPQKFELNDMQCLMDVEVLRSELLTLQVLLTLLRLVSGNVVKDGGFSK